MNRQLYPVSVKAAIFNDKHELLMIRLHEGDRYGMPGGHLEAGEMPDEAIRRELHEETGVKDYTLKRADFFVHKEGRVVLAYIGNTANPALESAQNNLEGTPIWISKTEFETVNTRQCYRDFVAKFWP